MKIFLPIAIFVSLSAFSEIARSQSDSEPTTPEDEPTEEVSEQPEASEKVEKGDKAQKAEEASTKAQDSAATETVLAPLPFGALYSFGLTRKKDASTDLNAAGFARIEIFKTMKESLGFYKKLVLGLSYSGADIGGKTTNKGAYKGTMISFGLNLSGFTSDFGKWKTKTGASLEINKIKKIPSFRFGNSNVEVAYKPSLTISQAAYFSVNEGFAIGPGLGVQVGGISGWSLGLEALFAL